MNRKIQQVIQRVAVEHKSESKAKEAWAFGGEKTEAKADPSNVNWTKAVDYFEREADHRKRTMTKPRPCRRRR